jgi:hypothetical protein
MPNLECIVKDDIDTLRAQLRMYFDELAHGVRHSNTGFPSAFELLQFAMLDILTACFYGIPHAKDYRIRFIDNIRKIADGLEKHGLEGDSNGKVQINNE